MSFDFSAIGVILMMFAGGLGLSPQVGVPLPPDAALERAAPPEALLYVASSGQTAPDSKSSNQLEQLAAEPEVREFVGEIVRLIDEATSRIPVRTEQAQLLARTLPVIAKTVLSRPLMLYLAEVKLPPQAPGGNAGLVINAGDDADKFADALEELEGLYLKNIPPTMSVEKSQVGKTTLRKLPTPPGVPPVVWGKQGSYVFLAVGTGEAEKVAQRLSGEGAAPPWLADLKEQAGVPRVGALVYADLAAALKLADPLLGLARQAGAPVDPEKVIEALGIRHLRHLAIVTGLDAEVSVSKLIVAHDGETKGLLRLLTGKPLSAADLKQIPRGADFAGVGRFDAPLIYDVLLKIAGEIEPRSIEQLNAALAQGESTLGFHPRDDLLAGLGDTVTFYNSPAEGGLFFTGLCASISVRDRAKVEHVIDQLQRLAEARQSPERPEFAVRKTEVGGRTIHYVQFLREPIPLAPAWCLDDEGLVVALNPQMVRAHLTRPGDAGSLAKRKGIEARLATGDVIGLSYVDSQLMYEGLYSYAGILAALGAGALEKETGVRADLGKFPSYAAIGRHMRPSLSLSRATKTAWIAESYTTGPSISPASIGGLGMAAALLLPAVQSARETGRQNVSRNNMRMMGLAWFQRYNSTGRAPPRAIVDKDGKPLLSWRVALLPEFDQQALYQQFHLDEPWDSEHNRPLISQMPAFFGHPSCPELLPQGKTVYQIPTGKNALYDGPGAPAEALLNRLPKERAALVVEAARHRAVVWTKPEDVTIDETYPWNDLLQVGRSGSNIVFLGMNVQFLSPSETSIEDLKKMLFPRKTDE